MSRVWGLANDGYSGMYVHKSRKNRDPTNKSPNCSNMLIYPVAGISLLMYVISTENTPHVVSLKARKIVATLKLSPGKEFNLPEEEESI